MIFPALLQGLTNTGRRAFNGKMWLTAMQIPEDNTSVL
jgi:hypothetical protein